jgi:hypothetical protein
VADWPPERKEEWDEYRVVRVFCRWLEAQGWTTEIERGHADVVARRGDNGLLAEVKGTTKHRSGVGLEATTLVQEY